MKRATKIQHSHQTEPAISNQGIHRIPRTLLWLGLMWLAVVLVDGLWLWLDHAIASWDPADHLIGSLNYWWTLVKLRPWAAEWWHDLWSLSSKYPPLLYISTAPLRMLFGTGADAAVLVNFFYTAVLLGSVYGLGRHLFHPRIGLWAAGLCLLLPRLYTQRLQYFMDYPLVALVAASFFSLTGWRDAKQRRQQWLWSLGFGLCFGAALLMKQTALLFLIVPLIWVGVEVLKQRQWQRFAQWILGNAIALLLLFPWLRANWLFQISAFFNANLYSAAKEGDPPVHTLQAWTYYWQDLPQSLSYPLLILPLVGLLLYWTPWFPRWRQHPLVKLEQSPDRSLRWLAVFLLAAYVIWSAMYNKDPRYVMPYLPVLAVVLAYGLTRWPRRWAVVPWGTVGLGGLLLVLNLFPIGGTVGSAIAQRLSPQGQQPFYAGAPWPHAEIVEEIIQAQPYQVVNLGVLPSSAVMNQHNLTYYGNARNFRVYGRQMAENERYRHQDLRSLPWFISWSLAADAQSPFKPHEPVATQMLNQDPGFERQKTWTLPDGSRLDLHRRQNWGIDVQPLEPEPDAEKAKATEPTPVELKQVILPAIAPPGAPLPITYEWTGSWQQLHGGMVLLTWKPQFDPAASDSGTTWLHDHSIGFGTLHPQPIQANQHTIAAASVDPQQRFRVVERTAMLPPATLPPGRYMLEATYWHPQTGDNYPIPTPVAVLQIDPSQPAHAAPELDWVTQLRTLAPQLALGVDALDTIFDPIGRINVYDPVQAYLVQAEQSLRYRLQQSPDNLDYAYGLTLTHVLQLQVQAAIADLEQVVRLDAQNPYAYAYLAFVNLYGFRPHAADAALRPALVLKPDSAEIHALQALSYLLQGNLIGTWKHGQIALQLAA